jgi:hypothetical protein
MIPHSHQSLQKLKVSLMVIWEATDVTPTI